MEGTFYNVIYFEQGQVSDRVITKSEEEIEIEQIDEPFDNIINLAGIYNTDACGIERCHFQSTAAINCGSIEFKINDDCDFVSFDNIFNNTSGGRASDLIMNVKPYRYYIYEIFGHISNLTYSDRPTIIIGEDIIPLNYNVHRDQLDFIIMDADSQDRHKQDLHYQPSIGETLAHMALNYTGWDLTFKLLPGIHGIDGNDAWGLTLTIGRDSEQKDRIEYFYPQKVSIVGLTKPEHEHEDGTEGGEEQEQKQGEIEEVTIERSNGNSFAFKLIKTSTVVFENIKVQESRTRVDGDNAFVTTYDESHMVLDHMKFTNTDQQFELIKILSYSQVILSNNLSLNSSGSVIVSALYTNMNRRLTVSGNVFANEFFEMDILETKDHYITEAALKITVDKEVHFDFSNNTFRNLKMDGDSRSAPLTFIGWSLYMKVRGNIFEDNLNFGEGNTIISLIDGELGQLQDYFQPNRIIRNKERQDPPSRTYVANGHDYSLEMGELFNHLYVGDGIIPDSYYTEDVTRSDLQSVIDSADDLYPSQMYITVFGKVKPYVITSFNKPLLQLDIRGEDHIEQLKRVGKDGDVHPYEERTNTSIILQKTWFVNKNKKHQLTTLNITYIGVPNEFVFELDRQFAIVLRDLVLTVLQPPVLQTVSKEADDYVGYIQLQFSTVATINNAVFGPMKLKYPLGDWETCGAAIIGDNIVSLFIHNCIFKDIIINNVSQALREIHVGLIYDDVSSFEPDHYPGILKITDTIFEQTDSKKTNVLNDTPLVNEFITPAVTVNSVQDVLLTQKTNHGKVIFNNTQFLHCRGGALRVRNVDVQIAASC
ncbi:MAG: hypothetical protein EZS28_035631, partial [Streblomastix strix]